MPRNLYKTIGKSGTDVDALVAAIKEVMINGKAIRSIATSYKINKSKLSRYISKIKDANLDPSAGKQLHEFVSSLSVKTGGKTVCSSKLKSNRNISLIFVYFL